jgi:FkbM family methyltransferase
MVIYIDLDAYRGETVQQYLRGEIFERGRECEIVHAFDLSAYPAEWQAVKNEFPGVSIAFHQKAAGIADGVSTFGEWPENPQAQTCYADCENYRGRPLKQVERIDFVGWLQRFVQPGNIVICKMDIEGAEYEIMEQLINTGVINKIQHLHIEFHNWLFPAEYELREKWIRAHCPISINGWG